MNSTVALSTNIDTAGQLLTGVGLLKKFSAVHFFRDQVVKGERREPLAKRAFC